jgi:anhydro-N-acetylmuramic acid kinase
LATLQIGEASIIAAKTGITTVSDFRTMDVAVGGNGAPLTSTLDWHLFRPTQGNLEQKILNYLEGWRALQNIGGIGNVTFIPSKTSPQTQPIAFDTGPGNVFIDMAMEWVSQGANLFDLDGLYAATGTIIPELLESMQSHPYFSIPPPKTTGRELFTPKLFEHWLAQAHSFQQKKGLSLNGADFVRTITELTAWSIIVSYKSYFPPTEHFAEIVVSGGGSRNLFLMKRIQHLANAHWDNVQVTNHESLGLNSDGKETVLFALLGALCVLGHPGNIPSCTGASEPAVLGKISPGKNFVSVVLRNKA